MTLADVLRVALPMVGLALTIFALGAIAGRGSGKHADDGVPTWIYATAFVAWLMILVGSMLDGPISGLEWIWWLAPLSIALSLVVVAKQFRARRGRRSSGG